MPADDRIYDVMAPTRITTVAAAPIPTVAAVHTESLVDKVMGLTKIIAELQRSLTRQSQSRSSSRQRYQPRSSQRVRSKSPKPSDEDSGTCWYHRHFKEQATRCMIPCKYKAKSEN